jgi:hypothetical protein
MGCTTACSYNVIPLPDTAPRQAPRHRCRGLMRVGRRSLPCSAPPATQPHKASLRNPWRNKLLTNSRDARVWLC